MTVEIEPKVRRGQWPIIALMTAIVACYAPTFGRGFVSEDFIILRLLSEGRFFDTALAQLTGPWLGVSFFAFYRPLGTWILHLEWLIFGTASVGYQAMHLIMHLVAVVLVFTMVRRLAGNDRDASRPQSSRNRHGMAIVAATTFGLAPMAPNTVTFIASFATLFSTVAILGSVVCFIDWRMRSGEGGTTWPWAAWIFALFAVLTYEGAVVVAALVLATDLLIEGTAGSAQGYRRWVTHGALWGIVATFIVVRGLVLDTWIGGYPDLAAAFGGDAIGDLFRRLQFDFSRLILPTWGAWHPTWLGRGIDAALLVGTVMAVVRVRRMEARWWLLGLMWIYVAQLPFGTPVVVPALGRYGYLATVGVGCLVVAVILVATPRRRAAPSRNLATACGAGLVVLTYGGLLAVSIYAHTEAGERATAVRAAIAQAVDGTGRPRFVAGEPEFVRHERGPWAGVPIAQVLHWGLADALMPPFADADVSIYPLPRFDDAGLAPLVALTIDARWRVVDQEVEPMRPIAMPMRRLVLAPTGESLTFRVEGLEPNDRARLVLVARGHPDLVPVGDLEAGVGTVRLPSRVVETMQARWGGDIFLWVEARDAHGRLVAQSRVDPLRPAGTGSGP